MKTKCVNVACFLCLLLVGMFFLYETQWRKYPEGVSSRIQKDNHRIEAGKSIIQEEQAVSLSIVNTQFEPVFASEIDNSTRRKILDDMRILFSYVIAFEVVDVEPYILDVQGSRKKISKRIDFGGYENFPEGFSSLVGDILEENGSMYLVIRSGLIDLYVKSIAVIERNELAWNELGDFYIKLNNLQHGESRNLFFGLEGGEEVLHEMGEERLHKMLDKATFLQPSLLDAIRLEEKIISESTGVSYPFPIIPSIWVLKEKGKRKESFFPAIYTDGGWKILVVYPGT